MRSRWRSCSASAVTKFLRSRACATRTAREVLSRTGGGCGAASIRCPPAPAELAASRPRHAWAPTRSARCHVRASMALVARSVRVAGAAPVADGVTTRSTCIPSSSGHGERSHEVCEVSVSRHRENPCSSSARTCSRADSSDAIERYSPVSSAKSEAPEGAVMLGQLRSSLSSAVPAGERGAGVCISPVCVSSMCRRTQFPPSPVRLDL